MAVGSTRRRDRRCGTVSAPRAAVPRTAVPRAAVFGAAVFGALVLMAPVGSAAETFRWSTGTDPTTLDPHAAAVGANLSFLGNIYEGLVRRGQDMSLQPALATRWEALGRAGWRFHLRRGVTFHDGAAFDAEDVLFSYQRATAEESDVRAWFSAIDRVEVRDSHMVDFLTRQPDPLFPAAINNWLIMDKGWAEANDAARPLKDRETASTRRANGTGPFRLVSRQADTLTVLAANPDWWDTPEHAITRAEFRPIVTPATRVAALMSGQADFIEPVPLQDINRLAGRDDLTLIEGIETRVIMFGFNHKAERLVLSGLDHNPLRDRRVRAAIYHAINAEAIVTKVMRGQARTVGLLIPPGAGGYRAAADKRLPHDRAAARRLLAEAGYPDGFPLMLRCPSDRYINDASICLAAVSMLQAVGIKASLETFPVSAYWPELRAGRFELYLLGWSPGGLLDASHPLKFLLSTPDKAAALGSWNFGGYSNAEIDRLYPRIVSEVDAAARQGMIDAAHAAMQEDVAYIPLHVQPLVWASRKPVRLVQRPDNFFNLHWVRLGR